MTTHLSNQDHTIKILFVCMGNICRSPAGEGILKHLIKKDSLLNIHVESCGVGDWHLGHTPDERMIDTAKKRGIILASRAQQFKRLHLETFDYILASDHKILNELKRFALLPEEKSKIMLMTAFSANFSHEDVPDPYSGNGSAFELVMDMLEDSCEGLLHYIQKINKKG